MQNQKLVERQLDVLFVNPNIAKAVYQDLANKWSAIENPTWSLLLAQSCRAKGFGCAILDCDAEKLSEEEAVLRIRDLNPKFVCFVTYSQNPNGGTTNFGGTLSLARKLKECYPEYKTISIGSHTSALPKEVLSEGCFDFVSINEGVYTLHKLLNFNNINQATYSDLEIVPGLGFKELGQVKIEKDIEHSTLTFKLNKGQIVPQNRMDIDLPGYAFDLLPYKNKPFDLYRAHNWHTNYIEELRSPASAIYTSLGCSYKCDFCIINILNRSNIEDNISSADSNFMRFWSTDLILNQFEQLIEKYNVNTTRISDEMYFLYKKHYEPLIDGLIERGYGDKLITWTYSRADSVKKEYLDKFRKAGVRWLAIGVESASQNIRQEISKGSFQNINVRDIIKTIRDSDINVITNYMFGVSKNEKYKDMQDTLDLALELNTESANFYCVAALPGSPLYFQAKANEWLLPQNYNAWSFHSYECQPLPTNYLTAAEVLKFRDNAWNLYFTNPNYLSMIEKKFGLQARQNVEEMSKVKLRRRLLGD